MSTLVDGLVERGLLIRREDSQDRRRVTLSLTTSGRLRLESAREAAVTTFEQKIRHLSTSDRATVTSAMRMMRDLFTEGEAHAKN